MRPANALLLFSVVVPALGMALGACRGELAPATSATTSDAGNAAPPSASSSPEASLGGSSSGASSTTGGSSSGSSSGGVSTGSCTTVAAGNGDGGASSPEAFAKIPAPSGLAVDADNLYVAAYEIGNVYAVPLAGGAPVTLDDIGDNNVAINSTTVFTVSGGGGNIPQGIVVGCAKTGCSGDYTTLATGQPQVWGVAADDDYVYWANQGDNVGVYKAPVGGGPATPLSSAGPANAITVGSGRVFYTGEKGLMSISTGGGTPMVLVPPPSGGSVVAVIADCVNVYYATTDGTIGKVPVAGGTPTVLASGLGFLGDQIAVDAARVYFAGNESGTVGAVPIDGGPVVSLATGQTSAVGIAVDATYVYWSVLQSGTVMRMVK